MVGLRRGVFSKHMWFFLDIIHHPDFAKNIIDIDDVSVFIDPDFTLIMKKEWHLLTFHVLVRWLKFSEGRQVHARQLLEKVSYKQMTGNDITNEVLPRLTEFSDCGDLIELLTSYLEKPFEQPFIIEKLLGRPHRLAYGTMHCAFGIQDPGVKADMMAFNFDWRNSIQYWPLHSELGILEPKGGCIRNYAFIVGGYTKLPECETKIPSASFTRYNMVTGETLNLEDLPQPSFWNAAVVTPNLCQLWVIGGVVKKGEAYQLTQIVNIYDIKTNKWKEGPRLPEPMSQLHTESRLLSLYSALGFVYLG